MIHFALNVLFVLWCLALLAIALIADAIADGTAGEANGGNSIGRFVMLGSAAVLAVSLLLKVVL